MTINVLRYIIIPDDCIYWKGELYMARPRKDYKPVSFKMDAAIYDRLTDFCKRTGQMKTFAFEKALEMYMDHFDNVMSNSEKISK